MFVMVLIQTLEAEYAAFRSIGRDGVDFTARLGALIATTTMVLPVVLAAAPDKSTRALLMACAFVFLSGALDARREKLASQYWGANWNPNFRARASLGLFYFVTLFGLTLIAKFQPIVTPIATLVVFAFPLRKLIDKASG